MQQPHLDTTSRQEFENVENNVTNQEIHTQRKRPTITKIVKIDYSPRRPKSTNDSQSTEFELSSSHMKSQSNFTKTILKNTIVIDKKCTSNENLPDLQSNFLKNKNDRHKCTEELQSYLSEHLITNKTDNIQQMDEMVSSDIILDSGIASVVRESSNNNNEINKSSSHEEITTKIANISIPISVKKVPIIQKSKIDITENQSQNEPRAKSYDPIKARQYMQEQKKKRSVQFKTTSTIQNSNRIQKEEIQKRLATLKENSLKIVANSLKNNKNKISLAAPERSSKIVATNKNSKSTMVQSRKPIINTLSLKKKSTSLTSKYYFKNLRKIKLLNICMPLESTFVRFLQIF